MFPVRGKAILLRHFLSTVLAQPKRRLTTCFLSATKHFCFATSFRPRWIRPFFRLPTCFLSAKRQFCFATSFRPCWIRPFFRLTTCFLSATKHFCFATSFRPRWIRPFFHLPTETCPLFPIHKKPARMLRPGRFLFAVFFTPRTSACTRRTVPCIQRCPHGFRAAFHACSCCGASRQ